MKKLMIAFAIVCAAAIAQAATVTWDSATLFTAADQEGGFSSTKIGTGATGYLFLLTAEQYNSFLADYNENGNMKSVYDTFNKSFAEADFTGTSSSRGSAVKFEQNSVNVGDTVYGAIIYTTSQTFGDFSLYFDYSTVIIFLSFYAFPFIKFRIIQYNLFFLFG